MSQTYVYAGLAGDTDPGRFVSAGLYRSADGEGPWESLAAAFPAPPQVRAILTDPEYPGRITIGTQDGVWRSDDAGRQWRRLSAPAPGLAVWSLTRHPTLPRTLLAGYEPAVVQRSDDDGQTWHALPLGEAFPDITLRPYPMPKRITGIAVSPGNPSEMFASIEVGGLHKTVDAGRAWASVTDGLYVTEDGVDLHNVVASPAEPARITTVGRIGCFRSDDGGRHWRTLPVPSLRPRGTYCRGLAYAPDDASTLYVGAGNDFDGDVGALFASRDDGESWTALDLGVPLKSTIFALAFTPLAPAAVYCTSKYGHVFRSRDRGATWQMNPLPPGAGHVFALGVG